MISVALCTYNGEKFIEEQLNSILNQTLPVEEIVICDDGSTDNTLNIINLFEQNNRNIKVFRNKNNLGTIKNFEKAISLTSGDIIFTGYLLRASC
ncbi:MAG: glycosyltransferase [Paludibacter sp.]|nr:glycosyltransferase [Paludibacter sp.]